VVIYAHGGWPGAFLDRKENSVEYKLQPQPELKAAEGEPQYQTQQEEKKL